MGASPVPLESVITTEALIRRPSRPADYEAESRALATLMDELGRPSPNVLQTLVETALALCRAHSAGMSLLDVENGREVFRWHAVAGRWSRYLGGTMPREASPCGTVLDRDCVLLMSYPERHFTYGADIGLPIAEALLVPFRVGGRPVGTLWLIAHDDSRTFDREDQRLLTDLAKAASAAHQVLGSHAALHASHRAKDEFLAMLAHELRNPLAAVMSGLAALDREDRSPVEAVRARAVIHRQLDHLSRLVDDLLDVNRLATGHMRLRPAILDLRQAVSRALETFRMRGRLDRHRVVLDGHPVPVEADESRIEQIVANLVENALKFTPPDGRISITVDREGDRAVLVVEDTGVGIRDDALPRIFDLFFRADSRGVSEGGLGVGLALVRRLVELHGGTVRASSGGPDKGTTITVCLPIGAGRDEGAAARVDRPHASAPERPLRILVVEDHDDTRTMLRVVLGDAGHHVDVASTGEAALARARAFRPDVMIIDLGLPDVDGCEVARQVRGVLGPAVRLVALTGHGEPEDRRRALEAGFDAHAVKPVDRDELARLLAP